MTLQRQGRTFAVLGVRGPEFWLELKGFKVKQPQPEWYRKEKGVPPIVGS